MAIRYRVLRGDLVVVDDATGAVAWRGRFGAPVCRVVPLPGTDDAVVLLDPDAGDPHRYFRNLLRVTPDGREVWRAELPPGTGPDVYVEVRHTAKGLEAWSFSCYHTRIDPETGSLFDTVFTK